MGSWTGEDSNPDPTSIDFAGLPDYVTMDDINRGGPIAVTPW